MKFSQVSVVSADEDHDFLWTKHLLQLQKCVYVILFGEFNEPTDCLEHFC